MARECENWLQTFQQWTMPRSEAPESFIFWTGLYTLAATVRRHIKVPKGLLGSWDAVPNLYILFIAPPGRARKSTTINYTESLLDHVPNITKSPELITKESLLNAIVKSPDNAIAITAPEFGEFIAKSGPDMYGFLTNMYDGKKNISASTLSRGLEYAERPCINLLGATTPIGVADNMPESVIGGGFASRVIFIYADEVRRRKLYYDDVDHAALEKLRIKLVNDLVHIAGIEGEFEISPEASKFMTQWYEENAEVRSDDQLQGYYERRPAHIHKIAMLFHVAYSDELVLMKHDFEAAIDILKGVEMTLAQTFQAVGKNQYTVDMNRIRTYVQEKGEVSQRELISKFYHAATPQILLQLVNGLVIMGDIKAIPNGTSIIYQVVNKDA